MNSKKDYLTPRLLIHQISPVKLMQASTTRTIKIVNENENEDPYTEGSVNESSFDGLFD